MVHSLYPGAAPEEVENQVTELVERELRGLANLKTITSVSAESSSMVTVEFDAGTDIDFALQKVRDRVDRARAEFPDDVEEPYLTEVNFSEFPVLQIHLAGDVGPVILKQLAEDLKDKIEAQSGVLKVDLSGSRQREVHVDVDPEKLRLYGLSLDDVIEAVGSENASIPGGELDFGEMTYRVRIPGEVETPREIESFVIEAKGQRPIFIRDVATVTYGFKKRDSYARLDGRESVALLVQKRLGANLLKMVDNVKALSLEEQEAWPKSVDLHFLGDQSRDIRQSVRDLENNILSGLVLVILVLMFALGFRNATLVGLAIPLSMLITFMAIQIAGSTLNMIVLFALVLSVGMLVDNGVVVIENIYRHLQMGKDNITAAREGTAEVAGAIIVSTLTTVGAFAPLLFWPGIVGDFMSYMPATISAALIASLVVGILINPVVGSLFMKAQVVRVEEDEEFDRQTLGGKILTHYEKALTWALDHRALTVGGMVGGFILIFIAFVGPMNTGVEFFPETEPPQIFVDLEFPTGTRIDYTDEWTRTLESRLEKTSDLKVQAANVGVGAQNDGFGGGGGGSQGARSRILLDLQLRVDREQSSFTTMADVREMVEGIPGAVVEVKRPDEGPPVGEALELDISGDDFATLGLIAAKIRTAIQDIEGLATLDDDFDLASPEVIIEVDRTEAARLGLSTALIARTIRTAVVGTEASKYRKALNEDDEIDIMVRLHEQYRKTLGDLERVSIVNDDGVQIPLTSVARIKRDRALASINHKDLKRVVTITGSVTSPEVAAPVRKKVEETIAALPELLPPGYRITFAGQNQEEDEAIAFLSKAFLYALLIVMALMVGKFDSVAIPVIIMSSVIMSTAGVFIGLMFTKVAAFVGLMAKPMPFGIIMTGLGVISLAGVVVNNAIVLLDYGEQLVAQGIERRRAVILTGIRRFRPVVLTAITTILGLIPLSTGFEFDFHSFQFATGGESSQWWRSMGIAVIFGLAFATFLTLVLVPVLYDLLLQIRERKAAKTPR